MQLFDTLIIRYHVNSCPVCFNLIIEGQGENHLTSNGSYLKAYSTISRFEYIPGVAPGLFIPLLLGAVTISALYSWYIAEAVLVFILLYFSGFVINSLVDRDIDRKYQTFKGKISEAVDILGSRNIKIILLVQVGLAVILSIHLSIVLNNIWLSILVGLGVLFGLGYSTEPFHFKVRGVWHAVALSSSAFFIPLLFIYLVVAQTVEILDILLILGVTIAHYSMEMGNQAADHMEDSKEGLMTPTVRLGLEKALKSSIIMTTFGMLLIIFTFVFMYTSSGLGGFLNFDALPIPGHIIVLAMVSVIIGVGYYFPIKGLKDLYNYSMMDEPLDWRIARIKNRIKYASWQASGIIGVVITLGILFTAGLSNTTFETPAGELDITDADSEFDINSLRIANVHVTTKYDESGNNYADVTVRLAAHNNKNSDAFKEVKAFVDAGTANEIFDSSYNGFDSENRAKVRVNLFGHNETKVWYYIYLAYGDERSIYKETVSSSNKLYMFDAELDITPGLIYDHVELKILTFNAGSPKEPGTITIKIEWAPLFYEFQTNNATVIPNQIWESYVNRDILKERLSDSSTVKIYLYYNDVEIDMMRLNF